MKTKRIWIVTSFLVLLAAFAALPVMAGSSIALLTNGNFDGPLERAGTLSPWTVTNGDGDKLKCEVLRAAPIASSQPCMFMFKGGAVPTTLQQRVTDEILTIANNTLNCVSANIVSSFRIYAPKAPDIRLTVKLKYTVSGVVYNAKSVESVLPLLGSWQSEGSSMMHVPRNAQFSSIVYQIRHANTAGKVYVDDARLDMIPVDVSC